MALYQWKTDQTLINLIGFHMPTALRTADGTTGQRDNIKATRFLGRATMPIEQKTAQKNDSYTTKIS